MNCRIKTVFSNNHRNEKLLVNYCKKKKLLLRVKETSVYCLKMEKNMVI